MLLGRGPGNLQRSWMRRFSSSEFGFRPLLNPHFKQEDTTNYRQLDLDPGMLFESHGWRFLQVPSSTLTELSRVAFADVNFLYRTSHLASLRAVFDDPESSPNDRFVAYELLRNACISAHRTLPSCQDTGTALIVGKKSQTVLTDIPDERSLSLGAYLAYRENNFRYSQVVAVNMFSEQNTKTNLPAQIDICSVPLSKSQPPQYDFLFIAKGGGSANKTQLIQKTKNLLSEDKLTAFLVERLAALGTAACPPYHLSVVIGGLSAEQNLKLVKLLSCKYLDDLPTQADFESAGQSSVDQLGWGFRDLTWEKKILDLSRSLGIGAQFGGKYFLHDVRVLRLPRHGASVPVGIGVSCSADRQAKAKITPQGVFIEQLETNPDQFLPVHAPSAESNGVKYLNIDTLGMDGLLKTLHTLPVKTRVSLTGTLIVARDIAHAKIYERLQKTGQLPDYLRTFPVYYAGPAKKPDDMPSGSFGPTTSGRMDPYMDAFMAQGGSMVTIGKGNRTNEAVAACHKYGGFYLGSIGGVAAALAESNIKHVEMVDFAELGMESVWKIKVENFPAFVVIDDKGNDFYAMIAEEIRAGATVSGSPSRLTQPPDPSCTH